MSRKGGIPLPNYTPVPNAILDHCLSDLTGAELKVLLYIIRRTFGFQKDHDAIAYSQFIRGIKTRDGRQLDDGAGISSVATLTKALDNLEHKHGLIWSEKATTTRGDRDTTVYGLLFQDDEGVLHKLKDGVLQKVKDGCTKTKVPVLQKVKTQEQGRKGIQNGNDPNRFVEGKYADEIEH